MGIAVIYAAYLAVSIALTIVVASALSRSGRVFLDAVFGGDEGMAGAVNRMLIVGFYLLSLGYVALTVRTSGQIHGPGQAIGVLSVKVGEELLVLGALYLLNIAVYTRFRRRQGLDRYRPETGAPRPEPGTPRPEAGTPRPEPGTPWPETGTPEPETGVSRQAAITSPAGPERRPADTDRPRRGPVLTRQVIH
jgi:hypothetical protein